MENQNYVLSEDVIQIAKENKKIRTSLSLALKASDSEIDGWLELNSPHGKLTNIQAVNILQQETHLPPNKILVVYRPKTKQVKTHKRYPVLSE